MKQNKDIKSHEELFRFTGNIEKSIKNLKGFTIGYFTFSTIVVISAIILSFHFASEQRKKIYVLDQGKSLILALQTDAIANRHIEAKDQLARFHELFFNLSPDGDAIRYNLERAFKLSDNSAYTVYADLSEKGFYNRLVQSSISQNIVVDSVVVDMEQFPHPATVYSRVYTVRKSNITEARLITISSLITVPRTDDNPHGFLIERFEIISNEQIGQRQR